ncbi:MAG: hypothetical protein JWQ81_6189 [Amycolatopsis sp.]|uniref:hypothetical protein n=1 Tax=Amycolatopsis sp. TaxID=37632 RepID=UPI00261D68B8|nr:hypothetical protein [Amycolatopsis sp.]MCU1685450.1 hypothetical protein [Amycolatopsis sp.]
MTEHNATLRSAEPPVEPTAQSRPWVPALWTGVGLVWAFALVVTGSPLGDVVLWFVAAVLGVLLPGVALVRAVRPGRAALIEDVGWGIPAGFLVAIAGWAVGAALPWAPPPWLFGPLVVAALFAIPAARPRLLARPGPGWGLRPNLVLCAVMLVVVAWMTVDFLRLNPVDPGAAGSFSYPDGIFQLSLVGELRHSLVVTYPMVAGEPYSYHWFGHAVLAHLLSGGVSPFDAVVRLAPSTLMPATVLTAAVVARGVAGRVSAGPLAAVLLGALGTTVATQSPDGQSQAVIQTYWWASITTVFGWIASLAVAGCAVAVLRSRANPDVPTWLLVPFLLFAAGAKSSAVPVLLGGAALAMVALLITRQRVRAGVLVLAATAATLGAATLTVYSGGSSGLHVDVFGGLVRNAGRLFPGLTTPKSDGLALTLPGVPVTAVLVTAVLLYVPLLPRLIGFVFLARWERRDPATWFFAGIVLAGAGATLVFRHPGESEGFFLLSAYPLGVVGSAWGLARAADHVRKLPWVRTALAGAAAGAVASTVIAFGLPTDWTPSFRHDLEPLGLLIVGLAVAFAAAWVVRRASRRFVAVAAVGAVLGTGLLSTAFYATASVTTYSQIATTSPGSLLVTRDGLTSGHWLDEHAGPHDILAANHLCTQTGGAQPITPCQAKAFTLSALSGRTIDVGGWAYASRNLGTAWDAPQHWTDQPFWDQARLTREQTAFSAPTSTLLDGLYRDGVRWLVADSLGTPADTTSLDRLAIRRLSLPTITIWQLRG